MRTEDCIPGTRVWYSPSAATFPVRFAGVVDGSSRGLGGTTVTRLRDMEPAYGRWRGDGRTTVPAAALFSLELREGEVPARMEHELALRGAREVLENAWLHAIDPPCVPEDSCPGCDAAGLIHERILWIETELREGGWHE